MFQKNSSFDQVSNNVYYESLRKEIEARSVKQEVTLPEEKTSKLAQTLDDLQEALVYENYDLAEQLVEEARKLA